MTPRQLEQLKQVREDVLPNKDFNAALRVIAKGIADAKPGQLASEATLFLIGEKSHAPIHMPRLIPMPLPALPKDLGERYACMEGVGRLLVGNKIEPVAAFLSSRGWRRAVPKGQRLDLDNLPPAEEIVFVSGMTMDGRCNLAMFPLKRSEGEGCSLGEPEFTEFSDEDEERLKDSVLACLFKGVLEQKKDEVRQAVLGKNRLTGWLPEGGLQWTP
jgi:hypothetical protein